MIVVSGSGKLYAFIGVTYPEGSTCTCTNGVVTLKAKDTGGMWAFRIPKAGDWTVTATNGERTKSETVSITAEGQFETVKINFEVFLFKEGSGLTSGHTVYAVYGSSLSTTNDEIIWATSASFGNSIWIAPAMALLEYNTVYFDLQCTDQRNTTYTSLTIGVGVDSPTTGGFGTVVAKTQVPYSTTRGTYSIDLSAITDATEYYIKLGAVGIAGKVYNIWLR